MLCGRVRARVDRQDRGILAGGQAGEAEDADHRRQRDDEGLQPAVDDDERR